MFCSAQLVGFFFTASSRSLVERGGDSSNKRQSGAGFTALLQLFIKSVGDGFGLPGDLREDRATVLAERLRSEA